MQTTLTATLLENQDYLIEIKTQLDKVVVLHNHVQRKLYKDIISYKIKNQVEVLPKSKINELKSSYQTKYKINARQYNSIHIELLGKINSVLELNKGYIEDTKDNILSITKAIKSKEKTLSDLVIKMAKDNYVETLVDKNNLAKLKTKLYYLKIKLNKANNKLNKLVKIEKSGNPKLCFGSNKLFRQQFEINKPNNLTQFKSHEQWKKEYLSSRNKSFILVGSCDETLGNDNCQIKHISGNIYELKVNVNPKEVKFKDRFMTVQIKVHNDDKNLIQQAILNNNQALTYRFYKEKNNYRVLINLDKAKQQPKVISNKLLGTVGIDINADHLAVSEIDRFGNLIKSFDLILNLKDKSSDQALDNIACAVKKITDYANAKNKPIVIEKLNFSQKKKDLKDSYNKKYKVMLSSFAYSKIIELIKNRAFDKGIEIIEVNPAYTSKIGKFKYQNKYKLTTHQAAAFVIARRGLLSYEKEIKVTVKRKIKEEELTNVIDNKLSRNGVIINLSKNKKNEYVEEVIESKTITVINKEKTISAQLSKYYCFELPVRNIQRKQNVYWKDIEQSYLKAKKHRFLIKRKKRNLIQGKQDLPCEITQVADNDGANRGSYPNLLFQPF
jgi:IS605 OrfB family transposase